MFLLSDRVGRWQPALRGLAAGLMTIAAVEGLLRPALDRGGLRDTAVGAVVGVAFLLVTRRLMAGRDLEVSGLRGAGVRHSALVFLVLFVHSLPEGMAMGAAHASGVQGLNVFVLSAIALQNVPEGTAVAIPMQGAGFGKGAQFWAAVASSLPQPIGAPLAYVLVEHVEPLLAGSLGFAGGAMLAVVAVELAPKAFRRGGRRMGAAGAIAGGALMAALSLVLGV